MSEDVKETVKARTSVHGEFEDVAAMDEALCLQMQGGKNWTRLTAFQRVGLKMIQHKVARILSGDPDYHDHWHDISGYAEVTLKKIKESQNVRHTSNSRGGAQLSSNRPPGY